jgi:glutathione peroxidase
MLKILGLSLLALLGAAMLEGASVYDFTLNAIDGAPAPLATYKGKVLLVVNVASKCGFTPQYKGLEAVYEKYKDKGLVIVGFPANNFGAQEPGTNEEIKTFCTRNYSVTFPMYAKISVKGADMAPLYQYLTSSTGGDIKWNFTKILIGKNGAIIKRFEPPVKPDDPTVTSAIEKALSE